MGSITGHCRAGAVKRALGCAALRPDCGVQGWPSQSVSLGGGASSTLDSAVANSIAVVVVGIAMVALSWQVTLLTLPYSEWHKEMDRLTQRQRILHTRDALSALTPFVKHASFLDLKPASALPAALKADVEEISLWDAQYTLMRELGHFPMSENPEGFREYLLPVLKRIRAQA